MSRVLVPGSTGYVGSRLVPVLLEAGHEVVAATRDESALEAYPWGAQVEARRFDITDEDLVARAVEGVDAVVYLVHSMASGEFVRKDREAAERVARAAAAAGVGRVVYLSGLIPPGELSDHLRSRAEVEQVFLDGEVPATVLRAAMVVGSGSTSFELLRRLSDRLPVMPVPAWMRNKLQPVSVEDVVTVLAAALEGEPRNRAYDLGADEVLSYPDLLGRYAKVAGLRRWRPLVPGVPMWVVGRASALLTGMPRGTVVALAESLSHDMVCGEDDVRRDLVPGHQFLSLDEAIARSLGTSGGTSRVGDVQAAAPTDPA